MIGIDIDNILREQQEWTVKAGNCVYFEKKILQMPKDKQRFHFVKVRVRGHCYSDGSLAVFHGPRELADYDCNGNIKEQQKAA